jgi:hypothetical protein
MKITVTRSILIEGNHVESGETVEVKDALASELIASRDAVKYEAPAKVEAEPKKTKADK